MLSNSIWAIYSGRVFDLTDYVYTLTFQQDAASTYSFLDTDIVAVFKQQAGQDITKSLDTVLNSKDTTTVANNMDCLNNAFYLGGTDFRKTARCQAQNYMLLIFSSIVVASMVMKCKVSRYCYFSQN